MSGVFNLFAWHMRRERRRVIVLGVSLAAFMGLMVAISDAVKPAELQEMFDKLPDFLRAAIKLPPGLRFTLERWVGMAHSHLLFLVLVLAFPLAAALRGIAGGVDDGTLEIVMAQPLSRTGYYLSLGAALLAGISAIAILGAAGAVAASHAFGLSGAIRASTVARCAVSGWALAASVAGITVLASACGAGRGRPGAWAIGTLAIFFLLNYLAGVWRGAGWLATWSLFSYHDPQRLLTDGNLGWSLGVLLGVGALTATAGLAVFRRRQLTF